MLLLVLITLFAQSDTVIVQTRDSESAFSAFEKDLVEDVFRLYELKHEKKITLIWKYMEFKSLFEFKDVRTISINAITITDERKKKYNFSFPYFPIKQAILTNEKKGYFNWKDVGTRICIEENSIHLKTAIKLKQKYNLVPATITGGTYSTQIRDNKFDICVSDITTTWDESNDLIVLDSDDPLLEISNYGILYPKNSVIQQELDRILSYYLKSPSYYSIIRKHFGSLAVKYIRSFKSN